MTFDLQGKRVLLCGALGHLGKVLATELASQSANLILCDLDPIGLSEFGKELSANYDTDVLTIDIDLRDEASIIGAFATLSARTGQIDAVINSSYPRNENYGRHLEDVVLEDFSQNLSWHLGGYFALSKHACAAFAKAGGGSLINISSIYGSMAPRFGIYDGTPMTMPVEYAAIKSGVLHLTRYFAQYYKKQGIRVNAVSPGGIFAHQPEAFLDAYKHYCGTKGMLDASDTVGTILFLVSDASQYVTGQDLIVDDGFSL